MPIISAIAFADRIPVVRELATRRVATQHNNSRIKPVAKVRLIQMSVFGRKLISAPAELQKFIVASLRKNTDYKIKSPEFTRSDAPPIIINATGVIMEIKPGKNIAIKVPLHKWADTVAYYRDKVGLPVKKELKASVGFVFGEMTLWIDRVERQSQVDVWLELFTDDPDQALKHLGSPQRDELEPLDDVNGHWTSDPAGVVLLVRNE